MSARKSETSTLDRYLKLIKNRVLNWEQAKKFLDLPDELPWARFFEQHEQYIIQKRKRNSSAECKKIMAFIPGKDFPAVSMTGDSCALQCEHCDKKYLSHMINGSTDLKLEKNLKNLSKNDIKGALLSGGCTKDGKVPLLNHEKRLKKFKENHPEFYLNSHVGLVNQSEAKRLKEIGIDTVSFDLILDNTVISKLFHLGKTKENYIQTYEALKRANLDVVPHILIGANFGRTSNELEVLHYLATSKLSKPRLLVVIVMIPPKKIKRGERNRFGYISAIEVGKITTLAHTFLPDTELSLGCMRPKISHNQRFQMEKFAIQAGATRMEIPSKRTLKWLEKKDYEITTLKACCAIRENIY